MPPSGLSSSYPNSVLPLPQSVLLVEGKICRHRWRRPSVAFTRKRTVNEPTELCLLGEEIDTMRSRQGETAEQSNAEAIPDERQKRSDRENFPPVSKGCRVPNTTAAVAAPLFRRPSAERRTGDTWPNAISTPPWSCPSSTAMTKLSGVSDR